MGKDKQSSKSSPSQEHRQSGLEEQQAAIPISLGATSAGGVQLFTCDAGCRSALEELAIKELQRFLKELFGLSAVSMLLEQAAEKGWPPGRQAIVLGVATADNYIGQILSECNQAPLAEQDYLIGPANVQGMEVLLLAGGSPASLLWSVYELAEFWGVRFLFDGDVIRRREGPPPFPAKPILGKPVFKLRAWRGMNQLPHSGAFWGLADYQRLIDQLAKMRFNCFHIRLYPYMPFGDFSWEGVSKQTAELNFGWRFRIDEQTIGREKFGDAQWFENPDIAYEDSYGEKVAKARLLADGIAQHARKRGMQFAVSFLPLQFTMEFRQRLRELSLEDGFVPAEISGGQCIRLGVSVEGIDLKHSPFMSIRNPRFIDLVEAQLRAYLQEFSEADYFDLSKPEFAESGADAAFAWEQLAGKHDLSGYNGLEDLIETVINQSKSDAIPTSPGRLRLQVCGDICTLYLFDELFNGRKLKPKRGRLVISLTDAVAPLIPRVLGPEVEIKCALGGYLASDAAKHVDDLQATAEGGSRRHVTVSLEDDNVGICPQFTGPSLDKILQAMRLYGFEGVWGRQWLLSKLTPTVYFLSHACWDPQLNPHQAYRDLIEPICGSEAVGPLLEAFKYAEQLTFHTDREAVGHSFLVPSLLLARWEERQHAGDGMIAARSMYQQLNELLTNAKTASLPGGRAFIDQFIEQARFAEHWITVREKLGLAAAANDQAQRAKAAKDAQGLDQHLWRSLQLLDEAIAASRAALEAWARAVRDRADLGALAALNEFGHRFLVGLRHRQYLRVNHWGCQLGEQD